jgi:hypothetical protein
VFTEWAESKVIFVLFNPYSPASNEETCRRRRALRPDLVSASKSFISHRLSVRGTTDAIADSLFDDSMNFNQTTHPFRIVRTSVASVVLTIGLGATLGPAGSAGAANTKADNKTFCADLNALHDLGGKLPDGISTGDEVPAGFRQLVLDTTTGYLTVVPRVHTQIQNAKAKSAFKVLVTWSNKNYGSLRTATLRTKTDGQAYGAFAKWFPSYVGSGIKVSNQIIHAMELLSPEAKSRCGIDLLNDSEPEDESTDAPPSTLGRITKN